MHVRIAALLLCLAPVPVSAEPESVLGCAAFKEGWDGALQRLEPGGPPLTYAPAPGRDRTAERVEGLGGLAGQVRCAEGKLSHVEIRDAGAGSGQPALSRAASALLMAFEPEVTTGQAAAMVEALAAEARPGHEAVSSWGPYELTFGRTAAGQAEFTAAFNEN